MSPEILLEIWRKFVLLAPLAGAACFYRCSAGELLAVPEHRRMLEALTAETIAVGEAKGIALEPEVEVEALRKLEAFPAEVKPSMLHDLEAGRRLELDWLNGTVVRLGQEFGVETPANAEVTHALKPYALGAA